MDSAQFASLESPFTEEEILHLFKETDGDKAPGPDGFSFKFVQSFGEVFKSDLIGLFEGFFENAEFDHWFSESFIALIPKVKDPSSLNELRPISLLGWIQKLVVRVLTSKLHSMIDQLISHTQTVFIASKVLDITKRNKEGFIFKLDFEKPMIV